MELRVQRDQAQGRWDWRGAGTARMHPKCIWGSKMPLVLAPSSLPLSSLELPLAPGSPRIPAAAGRSVCGPAPRSLPGPGDPSPHPSGSRPARTSRGVPSAASATSSPLSLREGARKPGNAQQRHHRRSPVRGVTGGAELPGEVHRRPGWRT